MNLFCIICAHTYPAKAESSLPEYADTCPKCRKILMEEAPGVSLYGTNHGYSIESSIEELEHRIPGLFNGPECPVDFQERQGCSCTYETGCRALKDLAKTGSYKKTYQNRIKVVDK
jgi:hypothetical protein